MYTHIAVDNNNDGDGEAFATRLYHVINIHRLEYVIISNFTVDQVISYSM